MRRKFHGFWSLLYVIVTQLRIMVHRLIKSDTSKVLCFGRLIEFLISSVMIWLSLNHELIDDGFIPDSVASLLCCFISNLVAAIFH